MVARVASKPYIVPFVPLLQLFNVFSWILLISFIGYNTIYGDRHIKKYYPEDFLCAKVIRSYRSHFGCFSAYEDVINTVSSA